MLKKISVFLLIALLFSISAFATPEMVGVENAEENTQEATKEETASLAATYTEGYFTYSVSNGKATITGCDTSISGDVLIPDTLGEYPVTSIGEYAFWGCSQITSVHFPDSVATIAMNAFTACSSLAEVVIPASIKMVGTLTFSDCQNLIKVILSEGVTHINVQAFDSIPELTVVLPSTLQYIGGYAFARCPDVKIELSENNPYFKLVDGVLYTSDMKKLVYAYPTLTGDFTVPDSVTSICDGAFVFSQLSSLTIPDTVTSMYDSADDSALFEDEMYWGISGRIFPNAKIKEIVIGKNVEYLDRCCFYACNGIESVTILGMDTKIDPDFVLGCEGITVYIHPGSEAEKTILEMEQGEYYYPQFEWEYIGVVASGTYGDNVTWTLDEEGTLTFRGTGKVCYTEGGTLPDSSFVIKKIVFDEGITGVEEHTFRGMQNLESIIMADSVVNIGYSAFRWCPSLTDIKFSKTLKTIQPFVFADCTSLTAADIPEGVKCITDGAFSGCTNLENVSIPDSVEYIVGRTFADCTKLEIIDLPKNFKVIDSQAFDNTAFYNNESNWNNGYLCYKNILFAVDDEYTGDFVVEDSIEYIALNAFDSYDYDITGKIIISENNKKYSSDTDGYLYSKDKKTVFECFYIWGTESISVPDGVEKIGAHSFDSVRAQSIILPKTVKTIEDGAFHGCSFMTEINIPNGVTSIGVDVFNRCYALEEITIPASVTHIGTDAFFWCGGSYESNIKIYGIPGSYAETYANENNIPFEEMPLAPGDINGTGKPDDQDVANLAGFIASNDISSLSGKQRAAANLYTADDGENGEPVINIKDLIALAQMMSQNK